MAARAGPACHPVGRNQRRGPGDDRTPPPALLLAANKLNASLSFLGSPADIILHPDDASANGVVHGQKVRVRTSRGEIILTANVSATVRHGVASIPHGHESANVNYLTSVQHVDKLTGMVRYSGIPIELEPITA